MTPETAPGSLLHVGCGGDPLPDWLSEFSETRLDIDPATRPDIVASMTDLGGIGPFDRIFCSHALEHLAPHEVGAALREFLRVLTPGGAVMLFVPDLEGVSPTWEVLFVSPAGPITGHDLYYGASAFLERNPYMAHRSGFVRETLAEALEDAGFAKVAVQRCGSYNLFGAATKA